MFRLIVIRSYSLESDMIVNSVERTEKLIEYNGDDVGNIKTHVIAEGTYIINGVKFVTVHPTNRLYFYEDQIICASNNSKPILTEEQILTKMTFTLTESDITIATKGRNPYKVLRS